MGLRLPRGRGARLLAGAALALLWCSASWPAEAPPAPPTPPVAPAEEPAPTTPSELTFNAARITIEHEKPDSPIILQGNVHVAFRDTTVEAEEAVLFVKSRELFATGNVRLARGASEILAAEIVYDLDDHKGIARDAKLVLKGPDRSKRKGRGVRGVKGRIEKGEADLIIVRAPLIRSLGPGRLKAEDVTITSCDFATPHWKWLARSVEVTPGRRLRSRSNTLYLGPVPVFHLPLISVALDAVADYPSFHVSYGYSLQWGHHVLTKFGMDFDGKTAVLENGAWYGLDDVSIDVDWRQKRGMAYGLGGSYYSMLGGRGSFEFYSLTETAISSSEDLARAQGNLARNSANPVNGTPLRSYPEGLLYAARRAYEGSPAPSFTLDRYSGDDRWGVDLMHRNQYCREWRLDTELHLYSDRDFRHEYFQDAFYNDLDPGSFTTITRTGDCTLTMLSASERVNDFMTRTQQHPELEWRVPGVDIGGGLVLSADFGAANLERQFDEALNIDSHKTGRVRGRLTLSRPFKLGGLVLRPFVGTDQAWYEEDARGEEDVARGAALYGGEISTKFYGELRKPAEAGIGGLRHIIEPRVRFTGVSEPTHAPDKLMDFDEHDDLARTNVVTIALDQRLQTKSAGPGGESRVVDIAALEISADYLPSEKDREEYNSGLEWDYLKARFSAQPAKQLSLYCATDFDMHQARAASLETGFGWKPSDTFRMGLDYRLLRTDTSRSVLGSEEVSASVEAELGPRWRLRASGRIEFEDNALVKEGAQSWSVTLVRDFHDWEIAISYAVDRYDNDRIALVSFTPKGYSRNLVRGSAALVPVSPDYSPVGWPHNLPDDW